MSHNFCPKCGKEMRHFDHHNGHHHGQRSHFNNGHHRDQHDHFNHHGHGHRDDCFCERFFCDDRFKVRLGGLSSGLNFRLRQLIGCEVKLKVDCGEECKEILAEICFVGSDFIEVKELECLDDDVAVHHHDEDEDKDDDCDRKKKKRKKKDEKFAIFPMDTVKSFELKDDCDCDCNHHDCDCC